MRSFFLTLAKSFFLLHDGEKLSSGMTTLHSACRDDFFEETFFSEQIVTFRSVFGPRVKRMWTFRKSVSPVSWKLHFTCPEELVERNVTIGKKNSDFLYFESEIFFHFWHTFSWGSQNCVLRAYTKTLGKKLRFLIWEIFFDVGENFWSGLTNLHSACPGNHFEITFSKSFKVALVFANRSGKFEAF